MLHTLYLTNIFKSFNERGNIKEEGYFLNEIVRLKPFLSKRYIKTEDKNGGLMFD